MHRAPNPGPYLVSPTFCLTTHSSLVWYSKLPITTLPHDISTPLLVVFLVKIASPSHVEKTMQVKRTPKHKTSVWIKIGIVDTLLDLIQDPGHRLLPTDYEFLPLPLNSNYATTYNT